MKTSMAGTQVVLIGQPKPDVMAYAAGSLGDHPVYAEIAADTGVPLFRDDALHFTASLGLNDNLGWKL